MPKPPSCLLADGVAAEAPPFIQAVAQALAQLEACALVDLVETHISWVLLTPGHAYKIKKPVKLPFLDFSTLALRKDACAEELRLNRRFAPELYLDVIPISGSSEQPQIAGEGAALEYAVKMRRFAQSQQLDQLLRDERLSRADLEDFGRSLAALHESLPQVSGQLDFGDPAQVHAPVRECLRDLRQGAPGAPNRLHDLEAWLEQRYATLTPAFISRKLGGRVRECHGDLHLGNLVKLRRHIVPFDCIEFSPGLRWIDVISDVAFLTMDLAQRHYPDLAYAFLNAYLEASGDYGGVRVLHYYLAYRALVRAKIALIRMQGAGADQRPRHARQCDDYIHHALDWTQRRRPGLVLMQGLAGSGKTRCSAELAVQLPAIRLRSDVERKRMHQLAPLQRSASAPGAGLYTASASRLTYARLADLATNVIEGGETAIVDATFLSAAERRRFTTLAQRIDAPCAIVQCQAPVPELERRLTRRAQEGVDASEADIEVLRRQLALHDPLDAAELERTLIVDTTSPSALESLGAHLRILLDR